MLVFKFVWFAVLAQSGLVAAAGTTRIAQRQSSRRQAVQKKPAASSQLSSTTAEKLTEGQRLNRRERQEVGRAEKAKYIELRQSGVDEVSNTEAAAALRAYKLRGKKTRGIIRKHQASLADVLFPGVAPEEYLPGESIYVYGDVADSQKESIPYEYYDLPGSCPVPFETSLKKAHRERKNLGSRLQGHDVKPSPHKFRVKVNMGCTPLCKNALNPKQLRWMRNLVERQYRVQMQLDQLPVLMRSKEYNYAVRGYPLGFQAPPPAGANRRDRRNKGELYLFNHLKFVVTYHEDAELFQGTRITGFDVHPVSIQHEIPSSASATDKPMNLQASDVPTCNGKSLSNDPSKYLALRTEGGSSFPVVFSYEVEWVNSPLLWTNRWDVYLVGAPDDDLHYFSILNSLMIVLFLTGTISTILIRTLRKDIAMYNDMVDDDEDGIMEETGWKLVHGDVFRPPQTRPMLLSGMVGQGAQIGFAFAFSMVCAMLKLLNPVQKGQTLTALLVLYVLSGVVSGYVSSRIYKFMANGDNKLWLVNAIITAIVLPGALVVVFSILNLFLSFAGAATAVSIWTNLALLLLWVCVSTPLVLMGAFVGSRMSVVECPTNTKSIARIVPTPRPLHVQPFVMFVLGGILPFGSVCIELAFIMSALWLHQIYYVMTFLLAVLMILVATCAQVSMVLTYLQLCTEDHRWWWTSFWNCASAGMYLFVYSVWFLTSRMHMVGFLPIVVYLAYMGMISICFGLVCGAVGFVSSFWFTRTIYGAVKVD